MLPQLRTYKVSESARKPLVQFMESALLDAGCTLLSKSDPKFAPFVLTFASPSGERMGIVAYAFTATRTPTRNRPVDERSFQIKYGDKRDNLPHALWTDPLGIYATILIGIDVHEDFFVAVDPTKYNPTKFHIRLEFKDWHADEIKAKGWFAWERVKRVRAGMQEPIEVLVGAKRERFFQYLRFERAAVGLAPGDRQLLAERLTLMDSPIVEPEPAPVMQPAYLHPLARELSLDTNEILEVIANARRLKMAVRGWVAEKHLHRSLVGIPGVEDCERLDQDGKPDLQLRYLGRRMLTIECKNALRIVDAQNRPRIDFQRTRASKADSCSRYYARGEFDILAGCLHAVTEKWDFKFVVTNDLPPHAKCPGRLNNNVKIGDGWATDAALAFERAYGVRGI
jgi:hypothetical protein